jgi:hypothetical protein
MADIESQLVSWLVRALLTARQDVPWAGLCAAMAIVHLYRRTRYLTEALRRERARRSSEKREHTKQLHATVTSLLEAFSRAPAPRLKDLAEDTETDFRLRS